MIARIEGILEGLDGQAALLNVGGGMVYEVLLPAFAVNRLGGQIGERVKLSTLHYLESQGQGSTFLPRLAGFLSEQDKAFYELFTTVKGIGNRKALRAMALASEQLAGAIADRDTSTLQSLPEIGKRTAETIVVSLKGKVDDFLPGAARVQQVSTQVLDGEVLGEIEEDGVMMRGGGSLAREALAVFVSLGENRAQAVSWIDEVLGDGEDDFGSVDEVVAAVYAARAVK
ncbi:Holliday junction branch migration protein RuvA [Poriferisphaera sp. WC338]|uniref:Holliday junction branch migration protein RuvA n=1 Tax=Poriferisphaera sp. WC338 TaxID=3425129 RepID=UPI003D819C28